MPFEDRTDAGRRLAETLRGVSLVDPVIFALPRGGVPVGFEVARALGAQLDVVVARKLGAPFQPELGVGAIAESGITVLEDSSLQALGLTREEMAATVEREQIELERRVRRYRGDRPRLQVAGRTAVVVDDGLATGVTARAALRSLRKEGPARTILAVPVAPPGADQLMAGEADAVVCVEQPPLLAAVGQWYRDFEQTSDEVVVRLLAAARSADGDV